MFNNIKYFLPTYRQCWVMVFYICVIGGLGIGALLMLAAHTMGINLSDINQVITYVLPLIPVFIYIVYKGNETAANNTAAMERGIFNRIQPAVPLNAPSFGKIRPDIVALLTVLATFFIIIVLEPLTSWIPMSEAVKEIYKQLFANYFWVSISVVVAAPLIEEFLLRGIMLRGLLHEMSPLKAILWSAFFFAFIHMNLYQALGAFILGVFIGWLYYKTRSLWLCILVHFVNNGSSILLARLFPHIDLEATLQDIITEYWGMNSYLVIYVISAAALGGILYYFQKNLNHEREQKIISDQI